MYREYIGRPVPVLHSRVIIDAPESLPLRRTTRRLPNADARETRANGRVRWVLDHGAIEAQDAMDANLPPDAASWASVEFSTGESWESVASHYLELTEPRIRKDDARRVFESLLENAPPQCRAPMTWRVPLHREIAEFAGMTPPQHTTPGAPRP